MVSLGSSARHTVGIVAAAIAAAAVWMLVIGGLGSAQTGGTETIRVFEQFGPKFAVVDASDLIVEGRGNGVSVVFTDPLLDEDREDRLGRVVASCVTVFDRDICHGTITLADRGTLTFHGSTSNSNDPHVREFPVVGGTGEFRGATGHFTSDDASPAGGGLFWTITIEMP